MKQFLISALSAAVGTVLYSRFISDTHQLDWERALFVGIFAAVGSIIFPEASKKNQER